MLSSYSSAFEGSSGKSKIERSGPMTTPRTSAPFLQSGQMMGMRRQAVMPVTKFNGNPMRVKSVNL